VFKKVRKTVVIRATKYLYHYNRIMPETGTQRDTGERSKPINRMNSSGELKAV